MGARTDKREFVDAKDTTRRSRNQNGARPLPGRSGPATGRWCAKPDVPVPAQVLRAGDRPRSKLFVGPEDSHQLQCSGPDFGWLPCT
jgi:hypothetical protein